MFNEQYEILMSVMRAHLMMARVSTWHPSKLAHMKAARSIYMLAQAYRNVHPIQVIDYTNDTDKTATMIDFAA